MASRRIRDDGRRARPPPSAAPPTSRPTASATRKGLGRLANFQQWLDRKLGIELGRGADDEDHRIVAVIGQQTLDGACHDLGLGAGQGEIDQLALTAAMPRGFSQSTSTCGGSARYRVRPSPCCRPPWRAAAGRGGDGDALARAGGPIDSRAGTSTSDSNIDTRAMPWRRQKASNVASEPAMAPVCAISPSSWPMSDRPSL